MDIFLISAIVRETKHVIIINSTNGTKRLGRIIGTVQFSRSQIKQNLYLVEQTARTLREHMKRYGYTLIETPIIDSADLFLTKAGDQIITRLFTFERHGQQLALRPEFTAAASHRYFSSGITDAARWQFSGPVFEDDPYDLARHYQRFSTGAELIGVAGPAAEAEVISMAAHGIALQGVPDWSLVIGHVGLMRHLLARIGLDNRTQRFLLNHRVKLNQPDIGKEGLLRLFEKRPATNNDYLSGSPDKDNTTFGGRTQREILRRLEEKRRHQNEKEKVLPALDFLQQWGQIEGTPSSVFNEITHIIGSEIDQEAALLLEAWQKVIVLLEAYAIEPKRIVLQPDLARSWDYYTGIVFEIRTSSGDILCGGGRYDELTRILGGEQNVPSVGFAYYFDQLLAAIPTPTMPAEPLLTLGGDAAGCARWAHMLRRSGYTIVLANDQRDAVDLWADSPNSVEFKHKHYDLSQLEILIADLGHILA